MRCVDSPVQVRTSVEPATSVEEEILQLEKLMNSAAIFSAHEHVLIHRDFLWNHVTPKTDVGSPRDHCKTTVAFDEYEVQLRSRVFCSKRGNELNNEPIEEGDDIDDDLLRDDLSPRSNDESICGLSRSEAVRLDSDDEDDNDDDIMLTQAGKETRLEVAMKREEVEKYE